MLLAKCKQRKDTSISNHSEKLQRGTWTVQNSIPEFTKLTPESVQGPALPLERVDYVHGGHRLPPSVLRVGHGVANHVLQEDLENTPGLFVYEAADSLHASSSGEPSNRRLSDALDVVSKDLTVPFGAALAQALASLSTARHLRSLRGRFADGVIENVR